MGCLVAATLDERMIGWESLLMFTRCFYICRMDDKENPVMKLRKIICVPTKSTKDCPG